MRTIVVIDENGGDRAVILRPGDRKSLGGLHIESIQD